MNKMILVSLRDSKADTWTPPKVCDSKASAIREFSMLVNDRQATLVSSHSADFDLFQVGEWSVSDGKPTVVGLDAVHLANGIDVKVKSDEK